MLQRDECYDAGRLSLLIESRLGAEDETAVTRHLDHCEACRAKLEELAADTSEWAAMRELLRTPGEDDGDFLWPGSHPADFVSHDAAAERRNPLSFLAPSDDPASLGRMGSYEVTGVIGRGGMSVVLKAFDRPLNRYVAVKVLAPQLAASAAARRRFEREAQAAAAVVHEHAIAIHAVAEFGGLPYLVMPYFPGRSLQRRLDETGSLRLAEILRIAKQVAAGLAAAHAQGLVHRDVKPANILLENGVERAVVTDFGLARAIDDATVTCSGVIAGTPQYMAPEQARGEAVDRRADLFSLGSVIYAMCTGRPPFRAETTLGVLRRVCDESPRPIRELNPEIPQWLVDLVARLHAKDPADRFQDARDVAALLEQGLAHVQNPLAVPEPPRVEPVRGEPVRTKDRFPRSVWAGRIAIGLAALVMGAGGAWYARTMLDGSPEAGSGSAGMAADSQHATVVAVGDETTPTADAEAIRQRVREVEAAWSAFPAGDGDPWQDQIAQLRERIARLQADTAQGNP